MNLFPMRQVVRGILALAMLASCGWFQIVSATEQLLIPKDESEYEVVHKGHKVRAYLNDAKTSLSIRVDSRLLGMVHDVSKINEPYIVAGTPLSVIIIGTRAASGCATRVLVLLDFDDKGRPAEIKPAFGECNAHMALQEEGRDSYLRWGLVSYLHGSAEAYVVVALDDRLNITRHPAKPCLFEGNSCVRDYIAAAYGPRGAPTGSWRIAGRQIATFQVASSNTGRIEVNGKEAATFPNVKALYMDVPMAHGRVDVFSVWVQSEGEACGYRKFLTVNGTGEVVTLQDRVGVCLTESITSILQQSTGKILGWSRATFAKGKPEIETVYSAGTSKVIRQETSNPCVALPKITDACMNKVVPAAVRAASTRPAR